MSEPDIAYDPAMARWEPGARERLQAAAIELFADQGFDETTVADIAAAAGVTERTFFRHFGDKREVLFTDQGGFDAMFTAGMADAADGATALELVVAAITALDGFFDDVRRPWSRRRQVAIDADGGLRERELLKLAGAARAVAEALRARGVPEPAATLAAETGMTVFRTAFAQWLVEGETRSLSQIEGDVLAELRLVTG
jgi:AcrR family transcriptional regulator